MKEERQHHAVIMLRSSYLSCCILASTKTITINGEKVSQVSRLTSVCMAMALARCFAGENKTANFAVGFFSFKQICLQGKGLFRCACLKTTMQQFKNVCM